MTGADGGVPGRAGRAPTRPGLVHLALAGCLACALLPGGPLDAAAAPPPRQLGPPLPVDPSWGNDAPACVRAKGAAPRARGDDHRDDDPRYDTYDLLHVELSLELEPDSARIAGSVVLHLYASREGCPLLLLDLVDSLEVSSCRRRGREVAYDHRNRLLTVRLFPPLAPGESTRVTIDYAGRPPRDGPLGLAFEQQGDPEHGFPMQPLISTLSETHAAAAWWPCKNVVRDKFTIDEHYTVPGSLTVAGNGTLQGITERPGGRRTFHWHETYPIASYLVSLAASNYVTWSDEYVSADSTFRLPIEYYAFPQSEAKARTVWARTPEMIAAFAARFGEYPFPREKYAMVEFNWPGAMENQTCTSYGTYYLLYDPPSNERVVAHELAHQWWGDQVSPATWNDIWLNEGFAVFCEAIWWEHVGGRAAYLAHMRDVEREEYAGPIVPPLNYFNSTVYLKGAWVAHMLRGVLGDEDFFRALREYLRDYRHGCATTDGFRTILEQYSGLDLRGFFDSWVYGTGRPRYTVIWSWTPADPAGGVVDLEIRQEQAEPPFPMPIPLLFPYADGRTDTIRVQNDERVQRYAISLPEEPEDLLFDPEGWVLKKVITIVGPTGVEIDDPGDGEDATGRWDLRVVPNPASGPVRFVLRREGADHGSDGPPPASTSTVDLRIVDVTGRVVRTLPARRSEVEAYAAQWDGRREDGTAAASGLYWLVASLGPGSPSYRFALTR